MYSYSLELNIFFSVCVCGFINYLTLEINSYGIFEKIVFIFVGIIIALLLINDMSVAKILIYILFFLGILIQSIIHFLEQKVERILFGVNEDYDSFDP